LTTLIYWFNEHIILELYYVMWPSISLPDKDIRKALFMKQRNDGILSLNCTFNCTRKFHINSQCSANLQTFIWLSNMWGHFTTDKQWNNIWYIFYGMCSFEGFINKYKVTTADAFLMCIRDLRYVTGKRDVQHGIRCQFI